MFYFLSLHVSGDYVPIIRRNNCIYATLGTCYSPDDGHIIARNMHRGADKSLAQPGRKQANVCQNGLNFLRRPALQEKKNRDSSGIDVVEIARVSDMLPSLFPSWSG